MVMIWPQNYVQSYGTNKHFNLKPPETDITNNEYKYPLATNSLK